MIVSGLDADNDWRFGKGRAVYLRRSEAIRQNVATRIRAFTDDWFLDIDNGIPWIDLLGRKDTRDQIIKAIERTVLATEGVREIQKIELVSVDSNRGATINISITDIFDTQFTDDVRVLA